MTRDEEASAQHEQQQQQPEASTATAAAASSDTRAQQQAQEHQQQEQEQARRGRDEGEPRVTPARTQDGARKPQRTPSSIARARWRQAGTAIQAVNRFKGIPALLPRADMSDRAQFPDTQLHRAVGWSVGAMFAIILISYVATLSYRPFHNANEAAFDFVAVHSLPLLGLVAVILHLAKSFVRAGTALYSRAFNRLPIHLQSAFSKIFVATCADFFVFVWAFDVLWIRDYGRDYDTAWFAQVTPIVLVLYVGLSILDLHQRHNWAWAAVLHHVCLMTAPAMFLDGGLRHRFCSTGPGEENCKAAVLRIFGVQLWGESFDLVLGIAYIIYLTGCRTRTLRDAFSAGLVFFFISKVYAFVHSLVLFIIDFDSFEPFFQAWYIVSIVILVLCQAFEMFGVLVLLGRLDILHDYVANTSEADDVHASEWTPSMWSCAKIAAKAHESAYRTYVSQVQGYKVPLLISVWDDMIIGAEYASRKRAAAQHDRRSRASPSAARRQRSSRRHGQPSHTGSSVLASNHSGDQGGEGEDGEVLEFERSEDGSPITHTMEELLAYLNGTSSHDMFDSVAV
ncbi:hypothetical protein PTSG_08170 [Salpingoeca rosetta]|uniref:Uncharacterized protein n=1 Tax=Salpingoeca rosetta (strain ATCC 50818 / BSB-021) TaxID=946362 RepID=F2UI73_SALR5|nr:uncharacterized protein PTSG_08170 [Salpingoeca rosetta]EGD76822.1 hypothetical protein PTSG_08170 [Salpingoeca rosetta]|eukprot:XP_004991194.1 hypothetical protein PTSG_08170 [Salpingoeca rosetta]